MSRSCVLSMTGEHQAACSGGRGGGGGACGGGACSSSIGHARAQGRGQGRGGKADKAVQQSLQLLCHWCCVAMRAMALAGV